MKKKKSKDEWKMKLKEQEKASDAEIKNETGRKRFWFVTQIIFGNRKLHFTHAVQQISLAEGVGVV